MPNKSEEAVIHGLAKRMANAIDKSIVLDYVKYQDLLDRVAWFFETEDAMRVIRLRMLRGKSTLGTYKELAIWAGEIESELRKEVEDYD